MKKVVISMTLRVTISVLAFYVGFFGAVSPVRASDLVAETSDQELVLNSSSTDIDTGLTVPEVEISPATTLVTTPTGESCCDEEAPTSLVIADNGANTNNTLNQTTSSVTNVTVNQNVSIKNSITGTLNTGNNQANNNDGEVSIKTGDIYLKTDIINAGINTSTVTLSPKALGSKSSILNNGSDSINSIDENDTQDTIVFINNTAAIENILNIKANTGKNQLNRNTGFVSLLTGNIIIDLALKNNSNLSSVSDGCCDSEEVLQLPIDPALPPLAGRTNNTTTNENAADTDESSDAAALGEVLGIVLPRTGNNTIWQITAMSLLLLLIGIYFRSENQTHNLFSIKERINRYVKSTFSFVT